MYIICMCVFHRIKKSKVQYLKKIIFLKSYFVCVCFHLTYDAPYIFDLKTIVDASVSDLSKNSYLVFA